MPADIDSKILRRLIDKGLLQLDELVESGVVEEPAIDRMMEEILAEENEQPSSVPEAISWDVAGDVFGRYQDLELLGEGGMAKVYKAYDPELKRSVALKFLRIEDARLKERLLREARAQAGIDHPNICKVYEVGELKGRPYIAMQHLRGMILREAAGHLGLEQKVVLIKQVAESLQEAHRLGLIHRDIKPSNIMVETNESGQWIPYLVDFGLARQIAEAGETLTDFIVGTPSYMSPEQAAGRVHSLDRRSDIYSLGVTFYELLSGQLPYKQSDTPMVESVITEEAIALRKRNSAIPSDLETIVMKCLEKEPERRYESARALAEDLQRYLNGDPILARSASLVYRLLTKAKRNRIATAIFTIAVLITLVLTGLLVWMEWRSRQQTQYANEYNQEVRYIESMMRSVYMAPLHDIRHELANAKSRLSYLERRIRESGKYAYGPGHNALGQGYLAIEEYEKAKEYLEKAWNAGYKETSTAYALGQTLGVLYQTALLDVERTANKEAREAKKQNIEKTYRLPAILLLKLAVGHLESPAYVEGLIAFYEKRYGEAKTKVKDVLEQKSWAYDARKLEGDAYLAVGLEEYHKGNYEKALAAYEDSGKAYEMAAQLGRSDQAIYLGDCDRWIKVLMVQTDQGNQPAEYLTRALSSCDNAILINSDAEQSYRQKSMAFYKAAEYQIYNTDQDPRDLLRKSIANSKEAIKRDPTLIEGYRDMAAAYWLIGEYEMMHGENSTSSFQESIANGTKSLELNANDPDSYNILGNAHTGIGEYKMAHGEDPRPSFQEAIKQFNKSLKITTRFAYVYSNLGIAYLDMGEYELGQGLDPRRSLKSSIEHFNDALKINPRDVYAYNNLGLAYGILGEYSLGVGEDPLEDLKEAVKYHQRALKINFNDVYAYGNIAIALLFKGQYELNRGKDPRQTFTLCIQECQKALKINPNYSYAYNNSGLCYTSLGKFEILKGESGKELLMAVQQYEKALSINADDAQVLANMAYAYSLLGLRHLIQNKNPTVWLDKARSKVQASINVDASSFDTYRTWAEIEVLAARWALHVGISPEIHLKTAYKNLQRCLELNDRDSDTYRVFADYYRWDALHKKSMRLPFDQEITKGIETATKALSLNPGNADASAILGVTYLLQARLQDDTQAQLNSAKNAYAALERALNINSALNKDYQTFFKEASALQAQLAFSTKPN